MENSSTSSSESGRAWVITVALALAVVVLAEVWAVATADAKLTAVERLNAVPGDDVFIFGNSMFQTGIDFAPLAEQSDRDISFDYHNGHYTSLWYLIADQALPQADPAPAVVVWGFRPFYAADPAFRTNVENDNDRFEPGDSVYRSLTIGSDEAPAARDVVGRLRDWATGSGGLWARRDGAQAALASRSTDLGVDLIGAIRPDATADFRERFANGEVTVTDEILRLATGGEVQLAEEQVVDGQGDFIRGPRVGFEDSFVPRIAEKLEMLDGKQLVVIWKPVAAVNGSDVSAEEAFVEDATSYFDREGIAYIDLFHDPGIGLEMYASGDHYNADGRAHITTAIAEILAS